MSTIEDNDNNNNILSDKANAKLKNIGNRIFKYLLIIALPFIIILLILAAVTWFIFMDEGIWEDDEGGNPTTYTNNTQLSTSEGITTDKMKLIKQGLLSIGYSEDRVNSMTEEEIIAELEMSEKLNKEVTSIEDCTVGEILWCLNYDYSKYLKKPEDLEYLLNAELVTQYPKIEGLTEDKLNGVIQFARVTELGDTNGDGVIDLNDGPKILTYITPEEFDVKFQNYIDTGNEEVFNYFTLDDQQNAVIATWSKEEGFFESNNTASQSRQKIKGGFTEESIKNQFNSEYTVTENSQDKITASYTIHNASKITINYKSMVQKYTLPFNYLWALLVMGESDEFVLNLAELAYTSQIVIGIYDSTTTTEIINTKNYTENFREKQEVYEDGRIVRNTGWSENNYSYYEKEINTTIRNSVQIDLMYANTWIVELSTQYKRNQTEEHYTIDSSTTPDEEWSDNGSSTINSTRKEPIRDETGAVIATDIILIETKNTKEKRTTGQSQQTVQNIYYDKYEKVKTEIREKTDIDPNTDQNFVKLLRADYNARTLLFEPINVVWLCDILSENSNTANMVELTKYLINKAKNPDDTSLSFDFSIFEYDSITGSLGGMAGGVVGDGSIEDKVWYSLRNMGFSEYAVAGVMGNIYAESKFDPAVIEYSTGQGFGLCQWTGGRRKQLEAYAAAKGVEPSDVDTQIEFLMAELTPGGGANGYAVYQLNPTKSYTATDFIDAESVEDAATAFCFLFERPSVKYAHLEDVRIPKAKEYYERYKGKIIEVTDGEANAMQLKIAEIAQNSSKYGIAVREGNCLGWVHDVYEAAGAKTGGSDCAYCAGYNYGVSKDFSNVPIGAAVYGESYDGQDGRLYGHVGIYIGNGMVADNIGYIRTMPLEEWIQDYPDGCWGWTSSTPINSAYPVTKGLIHAGRH